MRLHSLFIHVAILLALSLPYCINLGASALWDANEAYYAETPREMLASGDYIAPHFNFEPRTQKPPFTYWAILASYKLFGVSEFAVRLPSALAAIGVLLFSYGIARLLYNSRAAIIASMIAATTSRILILARRLPIDILLMFFLTGTLFFIVRAILIKKTSSWAPAYLFAGFGFLTKGPIALIIPGVAYILWALWGRRLKLREAHPLMGAMIFVLIALPWYAAIFLAHGWTYITPFLLRDHIGRFTSETLGPSRGFFYYFPVAVADFFPWSILILCAFALLWIYRKEEQPLKSLRFGLPLIWCACIFLLFSFSKNKQEYYIAPIYPVAAIILSGVLEKTMRTGESQESLFMNGDYGISAPKIAIDIPWTSRVSWWLCSYSLLALLIFLLSLLAPHIFRSFIPNILLMLHYVPSLVLIAGSTMLAWSLIRRKLARCFLALTFSFWAIYMMCALIYLPALEQYRPIKGFCRLIEARLGGDDEAGYFHTALPSMVFYLRRPIFQETDFEQMKCRFQSKRRIFCILDERDYNYFADTKDLRIYILDRHSSFSIRLRALLNAGHFLREELLLISNRPDSKAKSPEDRSTL
jgi:4-amino-4-deoxy-L-arabinose transferase-like glycosyltransferase